MWYVVVISSILIKISKYGDVAQLARASDLQSEGWGIVLPHLHNKYTPVAQLNRAPDYGSEG